MYIYMNALHCSCKKKHNIMLLKQITVTNW